MPSYLTILLRFSEVSGSDVPARILGAPPQGTLTEEEEQLLELDPEALLPEVPIELVPQDLTAYALDHTTWNAWEAGERWRFPISTPERTLRRMAETLDVTMPELLAEDLETVSIRIGSSYRQIRCQVSRATPICYECKRPLELYYISLRDNEGWPRGYCPQHMLHVHWRKEWVAHHEQAKREAANKRGHRLQTRDEYVQEQESRLVSSWAQRQRAWWAEERASLSPLYSHWREKKLLELSSRSSRGL